MNGIFSVSSHRLVVIREGSSPVDGIIVVKQGGGYCKTPFRLKEAELVPATRSIGSNP
jgi:hypothetical protein